MSRLSSIALLLVVCGVVAYFFLSTFGVINTVVGTQRFEQKVLDSAHSIMKKSTSGVGSINIEILADTGENENADIILLKVKGLSEPVNLRDVSIIYASHGGKKYKEYTVVLPKKGSKQTYALVNLDKLGKDPGDAVTFGNGKPLSDTGKAYVAVNMSEEKGAEFPDEYIEENEEYVLVIKLSEDYKIEAGDDIKIIFRVPYAMDKILTGYAPEHIENGDRITIK